MQPRRSLNKRQWIGTILAMAMGFYWMHTYSGPFRWLAEMQLRWHGEYEESITFLLSCCVVFVPLLLLEAVLRRISKGPPHATALTSHTPKDALWQRAMRLGWGIGSVCVLTGVALGGMGGYMWLKASRSDVRVDVTAADLERGNGALDGWVSARGLALFDQTQSLTNNYATDYFVPMVSNSWSPKNGVAVFLKIRQNAFTPDLKQQTAPFEGVASANDLPGIVRVGFERAKLAPASRYMVIDVGQTPTEGRRAGKELVIWSASIAAIGAAVIGVERLMKRKRSKPTFAGASDPRWTIKEIKVLTGEPAQRTEPPPPSV